jgi:hypothetical protein
MRAAVEFYWPGLGGKVADQWREWNRDLFDGALRPAPMVLSRMSSIHGHWFPLLDSSANQRVGTEVHLITQVRDYRPPDRITSIRRSDLLRGMMFRLRAQDGHAPFKHNSTEWCALVMQIHKRLTGETIWAAPEYERTEPARQLGKGLFKPEEIFIMQDCCPKTGAKPLPRAKIAGWPGNLIDLGHITKDD